MQAKVQAELCLYKENVMDTKVIHEVMTETQAGRMVFPEVVRRLSGAGVESYFVDFIAGVETVYGNDGETHTAQMALQVDPVAAEFSNEGVVAAIRGAQADRVRYPEFVKLSTAAGVAGYWAFLAGKKVIYFGRKGEMHIEEFPKQT
jgi:uncharacterized protein YbcV (DUF1398 family)